MYDKMTMTISWTNMIILSPAVGSRKISKNELKFYQLTIYYFKFKIPAVLVENLN